MRDPYFFGYGSLVNTSTHAYPDPQPASLRGWRRAWCHTGLREVAFLTVIPDPGTTIEGLVAPVPNADWQALDDREWAYERALVTAQVSHRLHAVTDIAVYSVPSQSRAGASTAHPILLSYLDVVVQGYLRVFGVDGATRFFETTDGWQAPILNDRADPRYPRHQALSADELRFVDAMLEDLPAVIKHLEQP
ncbi:gamma-glutamylcyclotransferase family protein [Thalassococcus sp. S3]|uniref:gamma-glutamylcyclotransferase family protein n=1 Tax=Thalassococcus sp. S3 TaxID=2017482 RepID=UPI0010245FE9|nr:gamma-glutamylcyclotransferase family protein [Thalassococcus sp. S3]QBF30274.1 gamma-glutamylcyclotransferase [Thalassococcus sp. S3]